MERSTIIRHIVSVLERMAPVFALWEGGSASFGRTDEFSDIDLSAVVEPGQVESVIQAVRSALSELSPIGAEYRQRTYHGDPQVFWQFRDTSEFSFVDMDFVEGRTKPLRIDPGIHGVPIVHIDRGEWIEIVEESPADRGRRIRETVERIASVQGLQRTLVEKHIRRGNVLEAYGEYQRALIRPLIELLRLKHCPERSSFHTTYISKDLPPEIVAKLQPLVMPGSIDAVRGNLADVDSWAASLMEELARA